MANGFTTKLANGRWRVRWRDPDGTNRSRTFDKRAEADQWLTHVRGQTALAILPLPARPDKHKLASAAEDWWERKRPTLRTRTAVVYETALRLHLAPLMGRELNSIKPRDVERLLATLPPETAKKAKGVLTQIYEDAMRHELCERNPARLVRVIAREDERPLRPESLPSPTEVEKIALAVPDRYRALVLIAAFAGLRLGEACGLAPSDVDLEARTIRVARQWNAVDRKLTAPKTRAGNRTTIFAERITDDLASHLAHFSTPDLVFPNCGGRPVNPSHFRQRVWLSAVASAGLPALHYHHLRHVFASSLIAGGVNVALVARLMGHSTPQVTLSVYSHFFESDFTKARQVLKG